PPIACAHRQMRLYQTAHTPVSALLLLCFYWFATYRLRQTTAASCFFLSNDIAVDSSPCADRSIILFQPDRLHCRILYAGYAGSLYSVQAFLLRYKNCYRLPL